MKRQIPLRLLILVLISVVGPNPSEREMVRAAGADAGNEATGVEEHWAFRRFEQPGPPASPDPEGAGQRIDRFVTAAQHQAGIEAVELANRRTLVRRLFFDLIGLPPTPDAVEAFLADDAPQAFDRLVDTLLERPEFGERWGRHWLDVARYADSNGCSIESNNTYDNAWRYRDYVIAALNEDMPFDQFVVEQIAGDLLDANSDQQRSRQLTATGFLLLGPKAFGTSGFEPFRLDVIDEQIDTVGKAMLGLSLGCARCHDHKFDPVTAEDYYGLAGIFASTNSVHSEKGWRQGRTWNRVALPGLDAAATEALGQAHRQRVEAAESGDLKKEAEAAVKQVREELDKLKQNKAAADKITRAQQQLTRAERALRNAAKAKKVLPIVSPVPVAMAVTDRDKPLDEQVRFRGQHDEKGDRVPRRVLPLLRNGALQKFAIPPEASGRLQLARWLVDPDQGAGPLLARVTVNRIWGHLMGRPLVASVDNFGVAGERPSHPELLEHLAATMVEDGWSVKRLIRRIVRTRTYRLAAVDSPSARKVDPDNRLMWRHRTRRIDAESLRDTLLMLSGTLDRRRGGKTLQHLGLISISSDYMELDTPSPYNRRSVYLPILRDALGFSRASDEALGLLATFDFADPNLVRGERTTTTVPAQSLFLMNSPFLIDRARQIADRLLGDDRFASDRERIEELFLRALGRPAEREEFEQAFQYLAAFPQLEGGAESPPQRIRLDSWSSLCQALLGSNEFLFL
ncbi:MAG: DUF1549 domain-containing protein, partial [Pirellulales bacterium]